jgi:ElaB/YqjD/DUF883 family membrane-anchored ribosome-binding protein
MSTSTNDDSDLSALRDDLAALKRDVAGLIEHLKTGATEGAQSAAEGAQNAVEHLEDGAHRLCRSVAAEGEREAKVVCHQIEEHPLLALLIAVGVGFIGGRALSR